ncbi:hypothetical protein AKJ09_10584 [Labilithrix luteola]|uniref:Uncharacterized protein n=1 Tax=Labilithrix luteola TaxID=1391654 RepID=A0A0K1QDR9_9BACT|nr:hypothetical protein [Labilithrix luteola]AKV03921.1 hypothetical protein AKJ09_10584 [Labilithrix luteola]
MKRYRRDPNVGSHLHTLVESAKLDELDDEKRRRVAERLGLLTAAGPVSTVVAKRDSTRGTLGSFAKAGLVVVGLGVSTLSFTRTYQETLSAPPAPADTVTESPPSAPRIRVGDTPPPVDVVPSVDVTSLPTVHPPPNRHPARHIEPASTAPKAPAEELRLEIVQLDDVRRAASANQPREALRLLDVYAQRFPTGKLREEALVLRIEALHASGDQSSAEILAKRLFTNSPDTPYAARVRAAVGSTSREEP